MLPSSDATRVQVPEDTIVTTRPVAVHTDVVDDVMVGVSPDVADATTENVVADQVRGPGFVNEMVFAAF